MSRAFLIAILTSGFLAVFAFVPPVIAPIAGPDISNAAHAINLNTSRSNVNRMGGGPGKKAGSNRMGGGPGKSTGSSNKAINLNTSRSNTP
jgi:hypothetical protein